MKKIASLFSTALLIAAMAVGIMVVANVEPTTATLASATVVGGFNIATYLGFIQLPAGILGVYIGAPGAATDQGAGVQVLNTERRRGAFMTYRTNPEYNGKDIVANYLRLEAEIKNGTNKLVFKTYVGDNTGQTASEKRLDRNDKFAIINLGFFIVKQADGKSNGKLRTYPNLQDFSAGVAADLYSLYNGQLNMTLNRKKILPGLDMMKFLQIPETQQSASTNNDQFSLGKFLYPLTPHIDLDGSTNNEIEIEFPAHNAWTGGTADAGFKHYAVLYFDGFLITGGSANI